MIKEILAVVVLLILWLSATQAQGTIDTVAGGVPNNVPAVSVGFIPTEYSKILPGICT
jgi:hypothetical protein